MSYFGMLPRLNRKLSSNYIILVTAKQTKHRPIYTTTNLNLHHPNLLTAVWKQIALQQIKRDLKIVLRVQSYSG